ncbi:uncharacterized protein N7484_000291 [Penicillium longicatenatum]|uniref:uncharacterized protein n=1 Tax=Penicillium longicatenatum TaxID=1561947 RepID=UPI0025479654|nr:uncharacterized protein N7484_000291 [Penicillium longicatenatum]KAJ5660919.1 hypothetical protein N7484_000291 [Penicillium longicatenatum]
MKSRRESGPSPLGCPFCDRTFTRQEHRERHIHSHTKTKPFSCEVCRRKFGRRDVYQRHVRSQHPDQTSLLAGDKKRGQGACDSCHSRKVKCNSAEHPCERCLREGVNCTFLRTLGDQVTRASSQINSDQGGSIPGRSSNGNFLHLQEPPSNPAWHQDISGIAPGTLPPSPTVNLSFQDVGFSEEFTSGLLDFDFTQTASYFDFNILDQIPPFPSLDLLRTPPVSGKPPETQSSRINGAYARLRAYSSPTDLLRPASPAAKADHESWLHRLGKKQKVQYDPLVINVFLNLFRLHVTTTFRCFEGFVVTDTTPVELWTSMASVGALYCMTPGSIKIAKSLYNHARIVLLSKVHHRRPSPNDDQLGILQTYMLLELFGYLSGDDRFHEISEVYHWEMIQIISTFKLWSPSTSGREIERKRTIEGICTLECYRVTILRGSATFSVPLPSVSRGTDYFASAKGQAGPYDEELMAQLQWMMSTNPTLLPAEGIIDPTKIYGIWTLCCLSLILPWAAIKNTVRNEQLTFDYSRRGEVLESALHKWFIATNRQTPIPTLMLFHMICLNLHVNVIKIQKLVHQYCGEPRSSPATTSSKSTGTLSSADVFPSRIDRRNAIWHSKQVIELAVKMKQDSLNAISTEEGPHFSYCVFFAALTLWYAEWQYSPSDSEDARPQISMPNATAALNIAIKVLSASPVQIAKKFIPTLESLVSVD